MKTIDTSNPFAQATSLSRLLFWAKPEQIAELENCFEDYALAFSQSATTNDFGQYEIEILCDSKDVPWCVSQASLSPHSNEAVEEQDWVAKSQADFKPMRAGPFYIYGSHITEPVPENTIPIEMDAGAAFGTGEHGTTIGCLELLSRIKEQPKNVLDMGCGTAILSIATAKLFPEAQIIAVDNCPVAVRVSEENTLRNHADKTVRCAVSDGFQSDAVQMPAPYDLILANILAKPLIAMAEDAAAACKPGGDIILSGMLERQQEEVLASYLAQGFTKVTDHQHEGWSALWLRKENA